METHDPNRQEDVYLEWRAKPCPECGNTAPDLGDGGLEVEFNAVYGTTYALVSCLDCGWWLEFDIYEEPGEEARIRY